MKRVWLIAICLCSLSCQSTKKTAEVATPDSSNLIKNMRQLTFDGKRSGEGYFSPDGQWMAFQSEREDDNPFYQIYLMNLTSGESRRISPANGKTTCAWIHPSQKKILFASTHLDHDAKKKQKAELAERAAGTKKRYAWDYDETYELFSTDMFGKNPRRLTRAKGYDAEGSYSPDGRWIVFASNRHGYNEKLLPEDAKLFAQDPSYMMDIYIMREDGSGVRRLTDHKGYDGGPFFSPNGKRITWRRFTADGHQAEIYTMKTDGSDVRKLTSLNAMSWAPFYHPSGDYLIFTTNILGYHNFELYIVDAQGKQAPVRASFLDNFDGLPVFLPNGRQLAWSRKMRDGQSQVFIADWNDRLARKLLQLSPATPKAPQLSPEIRVSDLRGWVEYLSAEKMQGRMTGSEAEKEYGEAVFQFFKDIGLRPQFQKFEFVSDVKLASPNQLIIEGAEGVAFSPEVQNDWQPTAISATGTFDFSGLVFAGYGIVAPAGPDNQPYDSYEGLDVKNRWVVIQRFLPEEVSTERRAYLSRYSRLEHKVMLARNRGAKGVIFVSGPSSQVRHQLIPLEKVRSGLQTSIPVISVTDGFAGKIFTAADFNWRQWLKKADKEETSAGTALEKIKLKGQINLEHVTGQGRNVYAELKVPGAKRTLFIGAHGDHLGKGKNEASLSHAADEGEGIHYGADDNASGVSAVLELAHYFSAHRKDLKNNLVFAVWSGEELGNLGSSAFTREVLKKYKPLAYLNFDMVGRLDKQLNIQGVDSSTNWRPLLEPLSVASNVPIAQQKDPYLPTDAISFYTAEVPVLSFFTGGHHDYHTPRDTADKINYEGLQKIASVAQSLSEKLAARNSPIAYQRVKSSGSSTGRKFRIFLGTIPDYTDDKTKGVKLSGVIKDGPAEKAGLQGGDVIVEFGRMKIENIYDYVYTLETLKPGETTKITVLRDGRKKALDITPQSRQ